jgi:hypothetical protein
MTSCGISRARRWRGVHAIEVPYDKKYATDGTKKIYRSDGNGRGNKLWRWTVLSAAKSCESYFWIRDGFRHWHWTDLSDWADDVRCSGRTGNRISRTGGPLMTDTVAKVENCNGLNFWRELEARRDR